MNEKRMMVFQTDFTYKEGAVCAMYGVVKSVDRTLDIIDGSHEIPKFDIWSASYRLYQSMKFWPTDTVFISVVDPGVGTHRRACVAKTKEGYFIVTPDNGSLTHVKKFMDIVAVRQIDETVNRLKGKDTEGVSIFHGRDLFGYCAAKLASGIISYEEVGPEYPVDEIVSLPILEPTIKGNVVEGIFEINDPNFGNLWTNIPLTMFTEAGFNYGDYLKTTIYHNGEKKYDGVVLFERSFGYAPVGDVVIYNNELMKIAIAVSQGSFCDEYNLSFGDSWTVRFEK